MQWFCWVIFINNYVSRSSDKVYHRIKMLMFQLKFCNEVYILPVKTSKFSMLFSNKKIPLLKDSKCVFCWATARKDNINNEETTLFRWAFVYLLYFRISIMSMHLRLCLCVFVGFYVFTCALLLIGINVYQFIYLCTIVLSCYNIKR